MGAQNGKDLLIKLDMTGSGQFETIARTHARCRVLRQRQLFAHSFFIPRISKRLPLRPELQRVVPPPALQRPRPGIQPTVILAKVLLEQVRRGLIEMLPHQV